MALTMPRTEIVACTASQDAERVGDMKRKIKALGPKIPCVEGKNHSVGIGSGICSNCKKQIHEPDPKRAVAFMKMSKEIMKQVFS